MLRVKRSEVPDSGGGRFPKGRKEPPLCSADWRGGEEEHCGRVPDTLVQTKVLPRCEMARAVPHASVRHPELPAALHLLHRHGLVTAIALGVVQARVREVDELLLLHPVVREWRCPSDMVVSSGPISLWKASAFTASRMRSEMVKAPLEMRVTPLSTCFPGRHRAKVPFEIFDTLLRRSRSSHHL